MSFCSRATEVKDPIKKLELLNAMNICLVDIDHPITIKKERRSES